MEGLNHSTAVVPLSKKKKKNHSTAGPPPLSGGASFKPLTKPKLRPPTTAGFTLRMSRQEDAPSLATVGVTGALGNCPDPDGKSPEIALTQMRKSVQKLGCSTVKHGDPTLMRFLIARSMVPDKAAKMFVQWLKWRDSLVPLGFISDSEVPDELEARKIYLQGLSRDGHPVMIVKASKHFPSKDQLQYKKFVVHLLDKTIASSFKGREIGNEKLIGVLDLQQITYKNIDARGLITSFQFLQAYYPERLAKCFILSMPPFFVSVWRMVSHFLEKATLEKIVIVSNEDEKRKFIREIGEEALPEEYGGYAKVVPIQDVVLTPMEH